MDNARVLRQRAETLEQLQDAAATSREARRLLLDAWWLGWCQGCNDTIHGLITPNPFR